MTQATLSLPALALRAPEYAATLTECGFELQEAPHAFWRARGPGCIATFYRSGKLVLQGPSAPTVAALLDLDVPEEPDEDEEPFAAALALHPDPKPDAWVGTDEVGKGDYFGPLVVAAVRVERKHVALLAELGAADSKSLSDKKILDRAPDLKKAVAHKLVVVMPDKYNPLQARMGNLNKLLAWAHARAIEDILGVAPATYALTDQFGDKSLVESRLGEAGRKLRLDQRPRAEADPAVAVASILARNEFVWRMRALSKEAGFELPKGAGPPVLAAAKRLVAALGKEALPHFAKVHFATTRQVLSEV